MSDALTCPACGAENPGKAKFCMECAAPLAAAPAAAEERKVVTTLFCDLVAFTAMSEAADPEDVDALLGEYFDRATKVIESHGGTVEKFIGDAVVGVFGVPAAHEDDPERALRAALRILEAMDGMTRPDGSALQARCGVNTGEALVRLDVDPASGRGFLTGDAVNVAARLEAAAPPGGVAVGALTHELTERVIVYEELPSVVAKGKAAPVAAWLATGARSRTGLRTAGLASTSMVGRDVELRTLDEAFAGVCAVEQRKCLLLVGEPGIGKSRLVLEFARVLEARPELVTWRQGRCLPYGEGVAFAALSEIVKAHAGIRDSDGVASVEEKLETVVAESADAAWLRLRLRPLLGLEAPEASREENFAAWALFLAQIAASRPTVLVFEDLHWADDGMLAFIEHLAADSPAAPLFLLATTRPELLQRRPEMLTPNASTARITLSPLTSGDTADLISALLDAILAEDIRAPVLERAGGNPLYAEEYVRLLLDRDLLLRTSGGLHLRAGEELPLPDTVQVVLAARLDTLPPEQKAILSDAAVFGETFWSGGVAALAQRSEAEVDAIVTDLAERQLVRPASESSFAGEPEHLFWHGLVRDVVYGELPRAARARKHARAAAWLESKAGGRIEELAEILAFHYVTALDLARAAGEPALADSLLEPAIDFLTLAGTRALPLDVHAAELHYSRALELSGQSGAERPQLLCGWARVLNHTNRHRESVAAWEQAIEQLRASGEKARAAAAICEQVHVLATLNEPTSDKVHAALDLLTGSGPSPELVEVLTIEAGDGFVSGERTMQETIEAVDRVAALSKELGLPEPAHALRLRGMARTASGDSGGIDDLIRAEAAAREQGLLWEVATIQDCHAASLWDFVGAPDALEAYSQALDEARRIGAPSLVLSFRTALTIPQYLAGEWDEASAEAHSLQVALEEAEDRFDLIGMQVPRAIMLAARGESAGTQGVVGWLSDQARSTDMSWVRAYSFVAAAVINQELGRPEAVRESLGELTDERIVTYMEFVPVVVRAAMAVGCLDLPREIAADDSPLSPLREHEQMTCRALLAEYGRDHEAAAAGFADAAARWHDFGVPYEEGHALLGPGALPGGARQSARGGSAARRGPRDLRAARRQPALAETDEWLVRVRIEDRGDTRTGRDSVAPGGGIVISCPTCEREWPDDAKFCMECGTPLAAPAAAAEERKTRHHPLLRPGRLSRR